MIDVVIPTYNRAKSIPKVIDSYLSQDFLNKIIFIDDCSTDNTRDYVLKLSKDNPGKIIYHLMPEKSTLPNNRNVGVSLATSEYIFMGEDDVLLPKDHFKVLVEKMKEYEADMISGRRVNMYKDQTKEDAKRLADMDRGPIFTQIPFEAYHERFVEKAESVNRLHSNSLIKKYVFEKVKYDPKYDGNAFREETDFYLRAWNIGFKLWLIPDTLSYHMKNMSVNQTGGSRKKPWVYEWQVWKNTTRLFLKNKKIFTEKLGVKNIYIYLVKCLFGRYFYYFKRRKEQALNRKHYAKT